MEKQSDFSRRINALISNSPSDWQAFNQALVNASSDCYLAVDHLCVVFLANSMASETFGAAERMPLREIIPELVEMVKMTVSNGKRFIDVTIHVKAVGYLTTIHPVKLDGDPAGAICVLKEATEFEKVLKQMRLFKNMTRELDAIIDSSSDGLFVCDAEATVIRVNPASERIHQTRAADLIGKNMLDLIEEGFIDYSAALKASREKKRVSLLQNKDNRKLISTGTPVFNDRGDLIRVVVSERDITEIDTLQRELEEQAFIKNQLQHQLLEMQLADLKTNQIVARSSSMLKVMERALKVSLVNSSILITGESGVGKGLIANLIHKNSSRADKPLIRINCGAIPESLIESELFGYESGAFTGARTGGKPGFLELADGGSLFLDEIAELPLSSQVKLLRFLEKGRVTRLGGSTVRTIDARIVAATHRDLKKKVANGSFRQDLFYRLNVIPLKLPALRERPDCIPPLLRHYIDHFAKMVGSGKRLSRSALDALLAYSYPGNVRELMNICERVVVISDTEIIDLPDLPRDVACCSTDGVAGDTVWPENMTLAEILQGVERKILLRTVKMHKNQCKAAAALGVSQPTIARRLKKYHIRQGIHRQ